MNSFIEIVKNGDNTIGLEYAATNQFFDGLLNAMAESYTDGYGYVKGTEGAMEGWVFVRDYAMEAKFHDFKTWSI